MPNFYIIMAMFWHSQVLFCLISSPGSLYCIVVAIWYPSTGLSQHLMMLLQLYGIWRFVVCSAQFVKKWFCYWLQSGSTECVLQGHDHPITCLLLLIPQTSIVLTGSSDKTIRVGKLIMHSVVSHMCFYWGVGSQWKSRWRSLYTSVKGTPKCCQSIGYAVYNTLRSMVCQQCLVKVDMDMFCSGGADICLWHKNGTLLSRHCRKENDRELMWCKVPLHQHCCSTAAIHTLLQVHGRHFCIIAAADYPSLGKQ